MSAPDLARLAAVAEARRRWAGTIPDQEPKKSEWWRDQVNYEREFTLDTCAWLVARVQTLEKLLVEDFVDFMRCRFCWLTWNPGEPPTHDAKCATLAPPAATGGDDDTG